MNTSRRQHFSPSDHGSRRRLGLVLAAIALAGFSWPGHAEALSQRGHVAAGTFGTEGPGAGQLREPTDVAVNDRTGDVYVVDAGNERIDRFDATGQFLEAWGWGVADGKKEYERCTKECRAGLSGIGNFELEQPATIAIDNSSATEDPSAGDVYVEARTGEHAMIDKFSFEGDPLQIRHGAAGEHFEELHGLSVAPNGSLWVYDEEDIYVFDDGEPNHACPEPGKKHGPTCPGFGIVEPELEGEPRNGLAVDGDGTIYAAQSGLAGGLQARTAIGKFTLLKEGPTAEPSLPSLIDELDQLETTGVAVDSANGDVYVDNVGSIAAFDSEATLVQRFGETEPQKLQAGAGVAVVNSSGPGAVNPGYVYVADRTADRVDIYKPEEPGAPQVDSLSVQDVTAASAQLDAELDPHGSSSRYYFEYGTAPCASHPGSCTRVPLPPGGETGAGFGDEPVDATASLLAPSSTYHYRLLANNALGGVASEERTFTTSPAEGRFLADARSWEMVSPKNLNGGEAEPLSEAGGLTQASADGEALAWVSTAPLAEAEGNRSLEATQLLSTRGTHGWSTQDIVTPNEHGTGIELGTQEYWMFSSSLALGLVQPFGGGGKLAEPPLTPPVIGEEAGHQEKTAYLRADAPLAPTASEQADYQDARTDGAAMSNPGFLALLTANEVMPGTQFGKEAKILDATPDLSHVVLESEIPLTEGSGKGRNLYEWSGDELALINVLPDGEPAPGAQLGDGDTMVRGAISSDGSRVFWNSEN
ncbi:MAG: hypothetical protein ACLQBB_13670, partial [Solirubrobacteraceae bacterium]